MRLSTLSCAVIAAILLLTSIPTHAQNEQNAAAAPAAVGAKDKPSAADGTQDGPEKGTTQGQIGADAVNDSTVAKTETAPTNSLASQITSLPKCFLTCAGTAASDSGCKGLSEDLPCVCASSSFANSTSKCVTTSTDASCNAVAGNVTSLTQAYQIFSSICSAVGGAGSNTTASTATGHVTDDTSTAPATTESPSTTSSNHNGSTSSAYTAANTEGHNNTAANTSSGGQTSTTKGENAGFTVQPDLTHVAAAAALVVSFLALGGTSLV